VTDDTPTEASPAEPAPSAPPPAPEPPAPEPPAQAEPPPVSLEPPPADQNLLDMTFAETPSVTKTLTPPAPDLHLEDIQTRSKDEG
jgi:hypothetical protein